ncbi:Putative transposase domain protein [Candidatus Bandiella woodruffii]|uniref:Transposase domain protein n=1 Tax=Candidatus Bandiella euplotis TaxID=1664265 RepID=A0ABZ0ULV5_9RICK|nr:Putative transposase domain protein [Candidatus Bandiella woodruffii]
MRQNLFFHPPYSEGKSLQGEPVLNIQNTALMNLLLLCAKPPHVPSLPGK